MKRRFSLRLLLATLLASAAFTVPAQTVTTSAEATADAQATSVIGSDADSIAEKNAKTDIDRLCLRETGSRIVPRDKTGKRCTAFGRVYTQEDIRSTGAVDLADALRKLDPAIR